MIKIDMLKSAGAFAENKDVARSLRTGKILPAVADGKEVVLDFVGVEGATQSFIHALISDVIRIHGTGVLDHIVFKNCNASIKRIVDIVVDYMQESD